MNESDIFAVGTQRLLIIETVDQVSQHVVGQCQFLLFIASSRGGSDLCGQRIKIKKQKFAEFMHLVGHFSSGFSISMQSFVPIQSQFMCPCLQFRSNAVFRSHFVYTFLDFPRFNIRREIFECQLHGFSVHAACRIEVTGKFGCGSLPKRFGDDVGHFVGSVIWARRWVNRKNIKRCSIHQISVVGRWLSTVSDGGIEQSTDGHATRITRRRDGVGVGPLRDGELVFKFESASRSTAMRAIKNECGHIFSE